MGGVTLEAEEIAAIVPVPEAVVSDSAIELWSEVQAGLTEAVGVTIDQAQLTHPEDERGLAAVDAAYTAQVVPLRRKAS